MDDGAVSHGVGEGDAHFDHIHAFLFEGADGVGCAVQCGVTGTEVDGEDVFALGGEEVVDSVHHIIYNFMIDNLQFIKV